MSSQNMHSHPTLLHPIIIFDPFTKSGVDFMDCNPASTRRYHHIILVVDYFTEWEEAMPIIKYDGEKTTHFMFNHIITQFRIPKEIVTDHRSHFQNKMMSELALNMGFKQENSSSYYPQENGQLEVVIIYLKAIPKKPSQKARIIGISCCIMLCGITKS